MTEPSRRRLEWLDVDGVLFANCIRCEELLTKSGMREAVHSVALEHPGTSPDALAKRTVERYHQSGHPDTL